MKNYCAFNKDHKCINYTDYEIARLELEDASALGRENWIEIELQHEYIKLLQSILDQNSIDYPDYI